MIVEVFIVLLVVLKTLSLLDVSWTTTIVISLSLIVVEIRINQERKALMASLNGGLGIIADKVEDIEFRLDSKQDRVVSDDD